MERGSHDFQFQIRTGSVSKASAEFYGLQANRIVSCRLPTGRKMNDLRGYVVKWSLHSSPKF